MVEKFEVSKAASNLKKNVDLEEEYFDISFCLLCFLKSPEVSVAMSALHLMCLYWIQIH